MANVIPPALTQRIYVILSQKLAPGTSYTLKSWISDILAFISSNMKVEGLKRSLEKFQNDLNVVELVTDASTSVKKLLGKLK